MARAAINLLLQEPERAPNETVESRLAEVEAVHMLFMELKRLDRNGLSLSKVGFSSSALSDLICATEVRHKK